MDAIEREAARQGHETVVLDASIPARAFYLHRGYSVTGAERLGIEATERHPSATFEYERWRGAFPEWQSDTPPAR